MQGRILFHVLALVQVLIRCFTHTHRIEKAHSRCLWWWLWRWRLPLSHHYYGQQNSGRETEKIPNHFSSPSQVVAYVVKRPSSMIMTDAALLSIGYKKHALQKNELLKHLHLKAIVFSQTHR